MIGDLTNTLPKMDDITNMTHNSTQVIDMSFTNIRIAERSTNTDTRQLDNHQISQIVVDLLVLPILGVFGIVGNILSIVVLGRADIGFLIILVVQRIAYSSIIYLLPYYSSPQTYQLYLSMTPYLRVTLNVFHVASIYAVVIVTGDRYIAICRPLQSGRLSTTRNARWAVAVVWCVAVMFNIPESIRQMDIPCNNATTNCQGYPPSIPLYYDKVYSFV